jgi:hypothetical protein
MLYYVCLLSMQFAAACYLLALSIEESVCSCGLAHGLDNTPFVPLLENSHFYIVDLDDRVHSFFLCMVFRGVGICIPLVRCALLWFCASIDYLPLVLICKL